MTFNGQSCSTNELFHLLIDIHIRYDQFFQYENGFHINLNRFRYFYCIEEEIFYIKIIREDGNFTELLKLKNTDIINLEISDIVLDTIIIWIGIDTIKLIIRDWKIKKLLK